MKKIYSEINKKHRHSITYDSFDGGTGEETVKVFNNFLGDEKSAKEMIGSFMSHPNKNKSSLLNTSMFSTKTNKTPMMN
jgi:hypothetical protein